MSKYKAGDKVVVEIEKTALTENGGGIYTVLDYMQSAISVDEKSEPLSTYTEPLVAKIRRQAAEIKRLLAKNKELKAKYDVLKTSWDDYEEKVNDMCNTARAEGHSEAWELARKITCQPINGGFNRSEFEEIFGYDYISDVFEKYTYQEAAAKVAEWEKAKEEIKVGDVFEFTTGNKAVVMKVYEDGEVTLFFLDGGCGIYKPDESWHKTGNHIDVDSFLKQIGG